MSPHDSNESTPASKMSLGGGAGPLHPTSVQASRTKGPSKYMAEVRASELHQKADNPQEVRLESLLLPLNKPDDCCSCSFTLLISCVTCLILFSFFSDAYSL